jgi:hypothetical protein
VRRRRALPLLFSGLIPASLSGISRALFSLQSVFFASIFCVSSVLPASDVEESSLSFCTVNAQSRGSSFSTVIHKFAQTFLRNFIDAEKGKVYLSAQIEPEA